MRDTFCNDAIPQLSGSTKAVKKHISIRVVASENTEEH